MSLSASWSQMRFPCEVHQFVAIWKTQICIRHFRDIVLLRFLLFLQLFLRNLLDLSQSMVNVI